MRCRGGQFESEGSVLKYMTEGENAAGAADRVLSKLEESVRCGDDEARTTGAY